MRLLPRNRPTILRGRLDLRLADGAVGELKTTTRGLAPRFLAVSPQLRAYDDSGWSPLVTKKKPLSTAEAQEALKLINDTLGDVEVSKCPFPRHAVVLFDGDVPVASINVCFQCGDILVWPSWTTPPLDWAHWDQLTVGQRHTLEAMQKKKLSLHEHFFPAWKAFFRDKVGFPIDVKYDAFD